MFLAVFVLLSAGGIYLILYFYEFNPAFKSLFQPTTAVPLNMGAGAAPETLSSPLLHEKVSLFLLIAIFVLQIFALCCAAWVCLGIKNLSAGVESKLKKLENADIFFDLPLYAGLFGTVASFIIMTFNPQISRLIAYSSTLIGIIISVGLRVILLFPLRQKLLK